MNILLAVIAGLALLAALLFLIGSRLSRSHRAASRIRLAQSLETVWPVVRSLDSVAAWWPDVKRAERLPDQAGLQRYQQALGDHFAMILIVTEERGPNLLRTTIDAPPGAPFGGTWVYELTPSGGGTVLQITEEGWIDNALFRVVSRVMGYHRTLDRYLMALARRFGETAKPEHVP